MSGPVMRSPVERVSLAACMRLVGAVGPNDCLVRLCWGFLVWPSPEMATRILAECLISPELLTHLEPPFDDWITNATSSNT